MSNLVYQAIALVINHKKHNKMCDDLLESIITIPEGVELMKEKVVEEMLGTYWEGQSLDGCTIQLISDQGLGDNIQMLRYIKQIKDTWDCKIYLNCVAWHKQLKRLVESLEFIDGCNNHPVRTDFWQNILCLPFVLNKLDQPHYPPEFARLLKTKIPPAPILQPQSELSLVSDYKIGIAWHSHRGNTSLYHRKSLPIEYFKHLTEMGTVYNLLPSSAEQEWVKDTEITDLQDTVDLIAAMDEVWSVDTAVLHVAGSMKKSTTALLNKQHDPRWNKNVWYKNMNFIYFD